MIKDLTVVIMVFNRKKSLIRLLQSIANSKIEGYKIKIIFSFEKNYKPEIENIVKDFSIHNFEKILIKQTEFLGAEYHNLKVQQLALEYDNILILEDDSFVSPYIFDYAFAALNFYYQNKGIAAISLYPYLWVESVGVPFIPIVDGFSNYFQQRPTSHGLILNKTQVLNFNNWHESKTNNNIELPPNTKSWRVESWEKVWYRYLIEINQYVVFPRVAYNTVFGEKGYNVKNIFEYNAFQVPLAMGLSEYNFSTLENSVSVYDAFYEFTYYQKFGFENLEGNVYGTKRISTIEREFVIVNGNSKYADKTFSKSLKPIELNIILNNLGNEISIINIKHINKVKFNKLENHLYFHNFFSIPEYKIMFIYLYEKLKNKLKKLIYFI